MGWVRQKPRNDVRVLLACMPKSGSSLLSEALASLPGFRREVLIPAAEAREQELCPIRLQSQTAIPGHFVAQHHVRMSAATARYIGLFRLRPIVLVRNIFDAIVSYRDYLRPSWKLPQVSVPEDYEEWDDDTQLEFAGTLIAPWYFNFFLSWSGYQNRLLLTYEELTSDTVGTIHKVADYLNIKVEDQVIADILNSITAKRSRFNIGKTGRGEMVPARVRKTVLRIASYYREVDFTPIGIARSDIPAVPIFQRLLKSMTAKRSRLERPWRDAPESPGGPGLLSTENESGG